MIINEIDKNLLLKEIYNVQEMNIPVELLGLPVRVKNSLVSAKDEFFKGISRPINMKLQRIFI